MGTVRLIGLKMMGLVLACMPLTYAYGQEVEATRVVAAKIEQEPVTYRVSTYGTLSPKTEDMSFRIGGRLASFKVEEGERVAKGQLLAQLETRDAKDALDQRKVDLDQAERNYKRMETLHRNGSIQASQLEDAADRLEQSRIGHEQARLNLDRCFLRASSDGLILRKFLESRTTVTAGQPIYSFQSHSEEWITRVDLTDRNAFALGEGSQAEVRFAPYPAAIFNGEITRLARMANPGDSLYTAEVTITNQGMELRPGMVAEVDIYRVTETVFPTVPLDALLDVRGNRASLYLLDETRSNASLQSVTIQSLQGDRVALVDKIENASEVLIRGYNDLGDGGPVTVVERK